VQQPLKLAEAGNTSLFTEVSGSRLLRTLFFPNVGRPRAYAIDEGTNEGDRLEVELRAELQQIGEQINDLRASLE
jgi:hypothetical protein